MIEQVSLLVSTFDKYSACWEPFCYGLNKYWPDHPKDVYFITNYAQPPMGIGIQIGQDRGWADNLAYALGKIDTPFILYSQEDYWIECDVNHQSIQDYLALLRNDVADYIRLYPAPAPDIVFSLDKRLGVIRRDSEYRTSLQMALWRKSTFQYLLRSGESPWLFEINGSKRSREFGDRFLSVLNHNDGVRYVFTAVVDGEWSKKAYEYAIKEEVTIDFSKLPEKPFLKRYKSRIKRHLYKKLRPFQKKLHKMLRHN